MLVQINSLQENGRKKFKLRKFCVLSFHSH